MAKTVADVMNKGEAANNLWRTNPGKYERNLKKSLKGSRVTMPDGSSAVMRDRVRRNG